MYSPQLFWTPVLPNTQSDDSGFGTEDGSEYSKQDVFHKKPQRWKGADEQGEYEVQKIVDHRFGKVSITHFLESNLI